MASRISQDGANGHGIGPCGVIAPAIGEDHRALGHGHIHAGRERQHIDDNHHITDGGQDGDPMRSPLTTDIEFLLVECHDALFSLFQSTGGLRLPNAGGEQRSRSWRQSVPVRCSVLLEKGSQPLPPCAAADCFSSFPYLWTTSARASWS